MKFLSSIYSSNKYNFLQYDLFLYQLILTSEFCESIFADIESNIIFPLDNVEKYEKAKNEKFLKYLTEILTLLLNFSFSHIAHVNAISFLNGDENQEKYKEQEVVRIMRLFLNFFNDFIKVYFFFNYIFYNLLFCFFYRSYLFQFNNTSFKALKERLFKSILNYDYLKQCYIEKLISYADNGKQISTSLIENSEEFDCFSCEFDSLLCSEYIDNIHQKFKNNSEVDLILGPAPLSVLPPNPLFFQHLLNLITSKYLLAYLDSLIIISKNKNFMSNALIARIVLKLLHRIFLVCRNSIGKNIEEKIEWPDCKELQITFKTISSIFFNKECNNANQNLETHEYQTKKIEKDASAWQKEIKNKFLEKQKNFLSKNTFSIESPIRENEILCVCCKTTCENEELYGFGLNVSCSNLLFIHFFQNFENVARNEINEKNQKVYSEMGNPENDYWKIFGTALNINSCGHPIHWSCFEDFLNKDEFRKRNWNKGFDFRCPLCNKLGNLFLPANEKIENRTKINKNNIFKEEIEEKKVEPEEEKMEIEEQEETESPNRLVGILNYFLGATTKKKKNKENDQKTEDFYDNMMKLYFCYKWDSIIKIEHEDKVITLVEDLLKQGLNSIIFNDFDIFLRKDLKNLKYIFNKFINYLTVYESKTFANFLTIKEMQLSLMEELVEHGIVKEKKYVNILTDYIITNVDINILYSNYAFGALIYNEIDVLERKEKLHDFFLKLIYAKIFQNFAYHIIKNQAENFDELYKQIIASKEFINDILILFRQHYACLRIFFDFPSESFSPSCLTEKEELTQLLCFLNVRKKR